MPTGEPRIILSDIFKAFLGENLTSGSVTKLLSALPEGVRERLEAAATRARIDGMASVVSSVEELRPIVQQAASGLDLKVALPSGSGKLSKPLESTSAPSPSGSAASKVVAKAATGSKTTAKAPKATKAAKTLPGGLSAKEVEKLAKGSTKSADELKAILVAMARGGKGSKQDIKALNEVRRVLEKSERGGKLAAMLAPATGEAAPAAAEEVVETLADLMKQKPQTDKELRDLITKLESTESVGAGKTKFRANKQLLSTLKEIEKSGGASLLGKLGGSPEAVAGNVAQGRLKEPGMGSRALKAIFGATTAGTSALDVEDRLAAQGVKGFAGKGKAATRALRRLGRPGNLLTALFLGLMGKGILDQRSQEREIREGLQTSTGPLRTSGDLLNRLELDQAVAQRRMQLSRDPQALNDVLRAIAGGSPERIGTSSEVVIGNVLKPQRSQKQTDELLSRLLAELHQIDSTGGV